MGYWSQYDAAQRGAYGTNDHRMGGLAMLGALSCLGQITGTYEIDQLVLMKESIQQHHLFVPRPYC